MQGVKYFIAITGREYTEQYLDFLHGECGAAVFHKLTNGTATDSVLNYFGLEKTEKVSFEGFIRQEKIECMKKGLIDRFNINVAGNGIAFFIPVDGIGGESAKNYLIGEEPVTRREEEKKGMEDRSKFVLIITIADKGYTDDVMDAARSAGASGGTVAKAKGTGAQIAKFFGISITEEKEMVYIVSRRENRDGIMRAVMEKAGRDTSAHGVVFSLPVDSVLGIKSFEE